MSLDIFFVCPALVSFGNTPWIRGLQTFSVKEQKGNLLDFVGHELSIVTTQLCHCSQIQPPGGRKTNVAVFQESYIYKTKQGAIICLLPGLEDLELCPLFAIQPH